MSEWRLSSLAELIVPIESGKRPRGGADTENDGIPSIGGENITRDGTLNFEVINRVPKRFALSMRKGWLCAGDGLINKDGAQTGKVALYRGEFEEATVNEHVFILRARDGIVDSQFLFFQLFRTDVQMQIAARITGSAQPGLGSSFVDHVYIHHPEDMAAQKALAAQVQTVWSEITHTEALIAKQEHVRAGLMQDLFTRGVDETGRLRPPREEAPELYHETPMGWLPIGWEAAFLSERAPSCGGHLKTGPFGSSLKISHWVETGHPVITIGSLGVGCFIQDELLFVGAETARRLEGYRVAPGDIVFSRVADVGRSVVVDDASDGWIISSNLMRLRVDSTKLRPEIVHLQLAYDPGLRAQLRRTVNSSGRDVANAEIMNDLRFLSPPIAEQDQICELARQQQQLIQVEAGLLQKLRHQRTALLRDLLTPPTTAAAEPRIAAE